MLRLGRRRGQEAAGTAVPSQWGGPAWERDEVGSLLVWFWGLQGLFHLVSGVCVAPVIFLRLSLFFFLLYLVHSFVRTTDLEIFFFVANRLSHGS